MRPAALLVAIAIVSSAGVAAAQPSLHGAVGVGGGFTPIKRLATFATREASPLFAQVEVGGSLGPIGSFAHAAHLALLTGFSEGFQMGIMPSYLLFRRSSLRFAEYARVGFPIQFAPDAAYGLEVGGGGILFLTAGIGLLAELDIDYYRGIENEVVLGGHLGGFVSYEMLPR